MQPKIKVFVAEDHFYPRRGMITQLATYEDFEIVPSGISEDRKALELLNDINYTIKLIKSCKPDVVIMDIRWGTDDFAGIKGARQIKMDLPNTRVLLYSNYDEREQVVRAVLEGQVDGYVLKGPASILPEAIRAVFGGLPYFAPEIVNRLLSIIRVPKAPSPQDDNPLDDEEIKILKLVAQAATNETIANKRGFSKAAIRTKIHKIYNKLAIREDDHEGPVNPRVMAVRKGLQRGYLNLSDLVSSETTLTENIRTTYGQT